MLGLYLRTLWSNRAICVRLLMSQCRPKHIDTNTRWLVPFLTNMEKYRRDVGLMFCVFTGILITMSYEIRYSYCYILFSVSVILMCWQIPRNAINSSAFIHNKFMLSVLFYLLNHARRLIIYNSRKRWQPTGHMTLLRRWINVIPVDSTSQQRRVYVVKKLKACVH